MYNTRAYGAYKSNNFKFSSKGKILLMLLEGAVSFSKLGRQAMIDKDIKKAHKNIIKAENVFYELMYALTLNDDNELTASLLNVYDFIIFRLVQANLKKDVGIMNEIIPMIEQLRDTWDEAYKISEKIEIK